MVDLLQLAERVGVEVTVAGEEVQLLEEGRALLGEQLPPDILRFDLSPQTAITSTTSGTVSRRRFSMPIFRVIVELGQPLHEPRMWR
jgi:hypothetical protein